MELSAGSTAAQGNLSARAMASRPFLARHLTYVDAEGKVIRLVDSELVELNRPLIILGEPGMGKTALMERLAAAGGRRFVSARRLLRAADPHRLFEEGERLVIDALEKFRSVAAKLAPGA